MRIEQLWREMEMEAEAGSPAAWLTRFAQPQPAPPLLVALDVAGNRRALLLPLPRALVPGRREWPVCRGLEMFSVALAGQAHLGVRLRDAACADVFTALAEDVAARVAATTGARAAAAALLGRLRRWQKFLAAGTGGLSAEQQRGLYGELHTLRSHLLPGLGAELAVAGWRAPQAAQQDFQYPTGAVEVKTTTAKQPQAVRVTSERQLDDTGIRALFLHVVVLDEREVELGTAGGGECLPGVVTDLRSRLASEPTALELFDDQLLEAGYLDADVPRYEGRRFTLRQELTFRVQRGFPRLVERSLPAGIGDVNYALSLAACAPWAVTVDAMLTLLAQPVAQRGRGRL